MSEKRKSTLKAKVLTVLLIILFIGSCAAIIFAICTGQLSRESGTPPAETSAATETAAQTETVAQTEAATSAVTTAASATDSAETALSLGSTYDALYWAEYKAEYGSAGLSVLFGARTQGAAVTFEDNRFTVSSISYDEYTAVATGTFSFVSDSEIELRYDNSNIATAKVIETENSQVTVMDFPLDTPDTTLRLSVAR